MEPPPPYDVGPSASPRNSSDSLQIDEAGAETQPLTLDDGANVDPPASEATSNPTQPGQHTGGCCNIYSQGGCCNVYSRGGCCNIDSVGLPLPRKIYDHYCVFPGFFQFSSISRPEETMLIVRDE